MNDDLLIDIITITITGMCKEVITIKSRSRVGESGAECDLKCVAFLLAAFQTFQQRRILLSQFRLSIVKCQMSVCMECHWLLIIADLLALIQLLRPSI